MSEYTIKQHIFTAPSMDAGLYIVSTPIGNLADVTIRALETMAACDVIACEDSRVTGKLLTRFGITTPRRIYHEHNAKREGSNLLDIVESGKAVALVSDAGTPLVSDPGQRLVEEAVGRGLNVIAIPGASAPLAALTASGISSDQFTFAGFLPNKNGARIARLKSFSNSHGTLIFFEAPTRLVACLENMIEVFGKNHQACIARELTKLHEDIRKDSLAVLADWYRNNPPKGEIVVLLAPLDEQKETDIDLLLTELMLQMSTSRAAAEAARLTSVSKRQLYQRALELSSQNSDAKTKTNGDG